jgi:hypothetical protein
MKEPDRQSKALMRQASCYHSPTRCLYDWSGKRRPLDRYFPASRQGRRESGGERSKADTDEEGRGVRPRVFVGTQFRQGWRAMIDTPDPQQNFDALAGRRIVDIHVWAVREGLRGTEPAMLFMGLCQRLVDAGVPVWRAFAATRTLHPQWAGYSYTWWRDGGGIEPAQFPRGDHYEQIVADSVFGYLRRKSAVVGNAEPSISLRRRLAGPEVQLDFPVLAELAAHGATDYIAELVGPGVEDASRGDAVAYSFATDRTDGFSDDDIATLRAVLPVVTLAMRAYAGHAIAAGLLSAYLGHDAGRRVHQGAVERGSVETISAMRRVSAARHNATRIAFHTRASVRDGFGVSY